MPGAGEALGAVGAMGLKSFILLVSGVAGWFWAVLFSCFALPASSAEPDAPSRAPLFVDATTPDGERSDYEEDTGRSFVFKEIVLSGFYSFDGVTGLPMDDMTEDDFEISPRPPGNYIGLDYVRTFTSSSGINRYLPRSFQLEALDWHPRVVYNRMEPDQDLDAFDFAPQDFWIRFDLAGVDRLRLRLGQFVLPYGVAPILAPRQRFVLPVEATDLGLKWDWGLALKGPAGEYDWEVAATIGSGEGLHSTHLFSDSERRSYLLSGRIGAPSYWDFQNGLSFLYGDLPMIMGPIVRSDESISRWRIGYDTFYKHGTYLMAGAQFTFGQDGFDGDEASVAITMGETADVLATRAWVDWVLPAYEDVRLQLQYELIQRDVSNSDANDEALIVQIRYSVSTALTAMLSYRDELNRSMGDENDAIYLTCIYYAL
jgi:hypothetical protein